jgi:hypothetical protein
MEATMRRETLRDRAIELAVVAIVVYCIAFYALDLPDWLKVAAGLVLAGGWLFVYVAVPVIGAIRQRRVGRHR